MLGIALLIVADPASAENDLSIAAREYQQQHFDAALAALDRMEKSSALPAPALDLRGCIYMEQQKFEESKKAFDAAHAANPDIFAPRIHLGDLLLAQKKFSEARDVYQGLLKETNILMSNERLRFAILLSCLGEQDEANSQKAFQTITFPTETPAYYYAQAAWAFAHNKKSEAEDWLNNSKKFFDAEAPLWFAQHLYRFGWLKQKPPLSKAHD